MSLIGEERKAAKGWPGAKKKEEKVPAVVYPDPLTMANVRPGGRQGWVEIGATDYSQAFENYWTTVQFYSEHPELAHPVVISGKEIK